MQGCVQAEILAIIFCLLAAPVSEADVARPNVLLIMTDDQGYGDLGAHGNPKIKTPNLDAFAKESVRLEHFYVSPVCSPTRAVLADGTVQLPHRRGRHLPRPFADAPRRGRLWRRC